MSVLIYEFLACLAFVSALLWFQRQPAFLVAGVALAAVLYLTKGEAHVNPTLTLAFWLRDGCKDGTQCIARVGVQALAAATAFYIWKFGK